MTQWDFDLVALHGPQEMTAEDRVVSRVSIRRCPQGALRESVSWRRQRSGAGAAADVQVDDPQRLAGRAVR